MLKNTKTSKKYFVLAILVFALFGAIGLNLVSLKNHSSVGTSQASTQEPADINSDSLVDIVDLSILLSKWGTSESLSDLNNDGAVDIVDLSILLSKWGNVISEPTVLPEWTGDYETGDLSQFASGSWNFYPSPASASAVAAETVSPSGTGNYIGKYYAPSGNSSASTSVRAENIISSNFNFTNGQDKWFYFSTYLGNDVPASTVGWQVLAQWKNDGEGSPPISLIVDNGEFKIDGGYGYPGSNSPNSRLFQQVIAPASKSVWHNWLIHINFNDDPAEGYLEAWHNGQPIAWDPYVQSPYPKVISGSKFYPPGGTLYPGLSSYLKLGIYRSATIQQTSTYYHDNWRIGPSRESVDY